jgi:hypothetical protein
MGAIRAGLIPASEHWAGKPGARGPVRAWKGGKAIFAKSAFWRPKGREPFPHVSPCSVRFFKLREECIHSLAGLATRYLFQVTFLPATAAQHARSRCRCDHSTVDEARAVAHPALPLDASRIVQHHITMPAQQIQYSEKYYDDVFEYR